MAKRAPSVMTPEVQDEVIEKISAGMTLREIEAAGGPAPSTVVMSKLSDDAFAERYARAREVSADVNFDHLVDIARDTPADGEAVQKSKLLIDAHKWRLSKMFPAKFGDKIDHSVKGDMTINVSTGVPRPGDAA